MANLYHLKFLKQGIRTWNDWRKNNPQIIPDLTGADFYKANFNGANLVDAELSTANLIKASFGETKLTGTNFKKALLSETLFINVNLTNSKNLENCVHYGPSTIDHRTIRISKDLPEVFLRGCGFSDWEIEAMKLHNSDLNQTEIVDIIYKIDKLRSQAPISFYSCFISYSSKDDDFTKRLHADLQDNDVRCWFAPEDLKIGEKIRFGIDEAIRIHDKLLLILSENSINSQWVEQEVEKALEKERDEDRLVLFPIRIDDSVFETKAGWAPYVKNSRHIGDFSDWKNHDSYKKAFERLLRDLKADELKPK